MKVYLVYHTTLDEISLREKKELVHICVSEELAESIILGQPYWTEGIFTIKCEEVLR